MRTHVLLGVLAALVALSPIKSYALSFTVGEELYHQLSVCVNKEDALAIADAHKVSREKAEQVWMSRDMCMTLPIVGPKVGKVVHTSARGDDVLRVVEIVHEGKVVGYFLTSAEVNSDLRSKKRL